ncbi:hypothetical protein BT63DRAFT_467689 [Microthyrium microscopicum]|uniref:Protein kinase domain-containing protein n=1 Tax=Microthyrium microscopicum TaxID=703497 RepID=A0A6A6UIS4_9PEZI|nr:hypothetical protein BT63DRAFT_467689 [Microthyrium microscopicum]
MIGPASKGYLAISNPLFSVKPSSVTLHQNMEEDRVWHEPEVIVYGNLITPGIRCSAEAYDLANRKWYQLNVDSEVDDDEWMSQVIEESILSYYREHGTPPSFNVINASRVSSIRTFDTKPNEVVARPIIKKLHYIEEENCLPSTSFNELKEKRYLGRAVDRCLWNGHDCVFKRIEFDVDVKPISREITTRESLIKALQDTSCKDILQTMQEIFHVIPILAVVLAKGTTDDVVGILMPFGGPSLEDLAKTSAALPQQITVHHLIELVKGVRELQRAGVLHGDINDRNTLFMSSEEGTQQLVLVDLGSIAPEYQGDANALGDLSLWIMERSSWSTTERSAVKRATDLLQNGGDFDKALEVFHIG